MTDATSTKAPSLRDILAALDRTRTTEDVKREAQQMALTTGPASDEGTLHGILEEIKIAIESDDHDTLRISPYMGTPQKYDKFQQLFQFIFYLSLQTKWHKGVREGALLRMRLLIDELQRFQEAIEWGETVLSSTNDEEIHQIVLGDTGLAFSHQNRPDDAVRKINAALELARRREDKFFIAKYLGDAGLAYAQSGDLKRAEMHYELALEAAATVPNFEYYEKFLHDLNLVRATIKGEDF